MTGWPTIRLTQARQVLTLMDLEDEDLPPPADDLHAYYARLRDQGPLADAVDYVAHALPRLEAVAWAARILEDRSGERALRAADRVALDHALRWLGDQTDVHRRAAKAAAQGAGSRSAERMLGMAIFYAGGSIAALGAAPILAPTEACSRYVAGAVKTAAYDAPAPDAVMAAALDIAERIAGQGMAALARP